MFNDDEISGLGSILALMEPDHRYETLGRLSRNQHQKVAAQARRLEQQIDNALAVQSAIEQGRIAPPSALPTPVPAPAPVAIAPPPPPAPIVMPAPIPAPMPMPAYAPAPAPMPTYAPMPMPAPMPAYAPAPIVYEPSPQYAAPEIYPESASFDPSYESYPIEEYAAPDPWGGYDPYGAWDGSGVYGMGSWFSKAARKIASVPILGQALPAAASLIPGAGQFLGPALSTVMSNFQPTAQQAPAPSPMPAPAPIVQAPAPQPAPVRVIQAPPAIDNKTLLIGGGIAAALLLVMIAKK